MALGNDSGLCIKNLEVIRITAAIPEMVSIGAS